MALDVFSFPVLLLIQCGIIPTNNMEKNNNNKILEHLISLLMIVLSIKAKLFAQKVSVCVLFLLHHH